MIKPPSPSVELALVVVGLVVRVRKLCMVIVLVESISGKKSGMNTRASLAGTHHRQPIHTRRSEEPIQRIETASLYTVALQEQAETSESIMF